MLICKYCGTSNPDDNNFCDHCGQRLVFTETDASEPNKYKNNPFESIDSETTLPHEPKDLHEEVSDRIRETVTAKTTKTANSQPSETIKRCSRCNGTGKIKEKVPSMFGESFEYKTCPKCHGIGRYIIDENGKHKDIISDSPTESYDSAKRTQYSNQNTTTQQKNFKPLIALVGGLIGYVLLFNIFANAGDNNKDNNSSASESISSVQTDVANIDKPQPITEPELPEIEYTSYSCKQLSYEIPSSWVEVSADDDPDYHLYKDDSFDTLTYIAVFFTGNSNITEDGYFDNPISWFSESHTDVDYEYTSIANSFAFRITGVSNSTGKVDEEYYIDYNGWDYNNGGYIRIDIYYSPED